MKHLRAWLIIGLGALCLGGGGAVQVSHTPAASVVASASTPHTPATGMPWES